MAEQGVKAIHNHVCMKTRETSEATGYEMVLLGSTVVFTAMIATTFTTITTITTNTNCQMSNCPTMFFYMSN